MLKVAGLFMVLSFFAALAETTAGLSLIRYRPEDILGKPLFIAGIVHLLAYLNVLAYLQF